MSLGFYQNRIPKRCSSFLQGNPLSFPQGNAHMASPLLSYASFCPVISLFSLGLPGPQSSLYSLCVVTNERSTCLWLSLPRDVLAAETSQVTPRWQNPFTSLFLLGKYCLPRERPWWEGLPSMPGGKFLPVKHCSVIKHFLSVSHFTAIFIGYFY